MTLMSIDELYQQPSIEWVIEGVLPANKVSMVFGESQAGKSFLGIDWSGHILAELPSWAGHAIQRHGPVVYAPSEDEYDSKPRLQAWGHYHGIPLDGKPFYVEPEGIQLLDDASVRGFMKELQTLPQPPVLVVVDTLGKSIIEGNRSSEGEKDGTEMNRALRNADSIRRATGAAVVLVHHTTKDRQTFRGSAAFGQGVYMMARMTGVADDGATVTLSCVKLKTRKFSPIVLTGREVCPEGGDPALVFTYDDGADASSGPRTASTTTARQRRQRRQKRSATMPRMRWETVAQHMQSVSKPVSPAEVATALGIDRKAAQRHLERALRRGDVRQPEPGKYVLAPRILPVAM